MSSIEQPCNIIPTAVAETIDEATRLSRLELDGVIPSFVIPGTNWRTMQKEIAGQDIPTVLFSRALGAQAVKSDVLYEFSGRQPCEAHVDEVPEDLLGLQYNGMFNIHHVLSGKITASMVHTKPGYYHQDAQNRFPETRFNPGITIDLQLGRTINTYTSGTDIHETVLEPDDRIIFFECASPSVAGKPNVIHLFHRGSSDRLSQISRYYAPESSI